jgi:steroid 5-alpha reductase family enzyme
MTFVLSQTYYTRQIIVTTCVILWGIRISGFLLYRILKTEEDKRFDEIRGNFFSFLGFWIFQMIWVFTNTFCVMIANSQVIDSPLQGSDYAGIVMFIVGLLLEFEADRSKDAFRDDKANRGKFCNVSVWQWSRHPNYFGEMLLWWGIWTISSVTFTEPWMYATLVGPLFTMTILFFLSGMNLSEQSYSKKFAKNPDYKDYVRNTSILIPLPPILYGNLPYAVKAAFLFEWPMYYREEHVSPTSPLVGEAHP